MNLGDVLLDELDKRDFKIGDIVVVSHECVNSNSTRLKITIGKVIGMDLYKKTFSIKIIGCEHGNEEKKLNYWHSGKYSDIYYDEHGVNFYQEYLPTLIAEEKLNDKFFVEDRYLKKLNIENSIEMIKFL